MMRGVTVLLAGDFWQTVPVISQGTRADEVTMCDKALYLWSVIKKLPLRKNMRVHLRGEVSAEEVSELLLKTGAESISSPRKK